MSGNYPSKYIRAYASALLSKQNPAGIVAIPGAEHACTAFQMLADAALAQAKAGDTSVAFVELPDKSDDDESLYHIADQ